jgi:CRISPR-associated protein Csx16
MTTLFVTRHAGAVEWARRHQFGVAQVVPHLALTQVQAGDTVIGTLPVNLAAQVCAKGAAYWHLSLTLTAEERGLELSADDMERLGAQVQLFDIKPLALPPKPHSKP